MIAFCALIMFEPRWVTQLSQTLTHACTHARTHRYMHAYIHTYIHTYVLSYVECYARLNRINGAIKGNSISYSKQKQFLRMPWIIIFVKNTTPLQFAIRSKIGIGV